ncbi:hypothetical protein ACQPZG_10485 [Streptomyces sp. CA-294286]|uniref:hypothetical protein n=1 Tax=Streptomyces sp. CA-294286 TaxID=3240070 RepID=UPI003D8E222C
MKATTRTETVPANDTENENETPPETTAATAGAHTAADAGAADESDGADDAKQTPAGEEPVGAGPGEEAARPGSTGTAAGVAGVVSGGLGLVALVGGWPSRVLAERETLDGQLHLTQGSAPGAQIDGLYGNAWHMTALVNGGFALLAVLAGVGALLALRTSASRAAAGAVPRPTWMRVAAWGGVVLGILGLVISAGLYFDLFAPMPTPPVAQG